MRRILFLGLAAAFAVASCTSVVIVHDRRLGFDPDELERAVPIGASEQQALGLLQALANDPPNSTEVSVYSAEVVTQEDCYPRPCSLVDRGVPVGHRALTVHVMTDGYWMPRVCLDEYIANFIFDERGIYNNFIQEDTRTCL